ncbi:MAG: hypothetical protein AB1330_10375 [Bacillota bacterium]
MPCRSCLVSLARAAEDLFAATEQLQKAMGKPLPLEEAEKLVAEVEDAVYRCRRALNSARYLERGAFGRGTGA